ncbi:MAG: hypothetical protein QOG53_1892 [Frankiales bacterium]|jgi:carbamoyl-phosphate synthase large subunit|nr:hypothetical protein [Frankiales bacterium]
MAKIYIGGAGGAPSNNVIRSLRESDRDDCLIGASSSPTDLFLADVDERHIVPPAADPAYPEHLLDLLERCRPDFLHVQNDAEVLAVSRMRNEIGAKGVRLFLPSVEGVEIFVDKWSSYERWAAAGLPLPETVLVRDEDDLAEAFRRFGGRVWLRATTGGGGRGALPTSDPVLAARWIDRNGGWGAYTAAEVLTESSVAWLSLWHEGALVAAQARRRLGWGFGSRAPSGVTGVTAVGETIHSSDVTEIGQLAIQVVEDRPHGIYGVDMTLDDMGRLRVTEINVGRFFTTVYFFTRAGFNFPALYVELGMGAATPQQILDPLPEGLLWIRGMDVEPVLVPRDRYEQLLETAR